MSYPSDEWIKADPDFWKPKANAAAAPKKMEEKPAASKSDAAEMTEGRHSRAAFCFLMERA